VLTFLVAILLLGKPALGNKCPFISYIVEGRVAVPEDTKPEDVKIVFFLEGASRTSDYPPPGDAMGDFVSPDKDGHFRIVSHYSTRSESGRGCKRLATQGHLVFIGENVFSKFEKVSFLKRMRRARARSHTEDIGVVRLRAFPMERVGE